MTALDLARRWAAPTPVLVVDDDAAVRRLFRRLAENFGLAVVEADGVEEARAALAAHNFRAVFLDLHLGEQSALDLMPWVGKETPVVLMTGHLDSPLLERALDEGPYALLRKPDDFQVERIGQVLQLLNIRHLTPSGMPQLKPAQHVVP